MPEADSYFVSNQGGFANSDEDDAEHYQQDIDSPNHMQVDSNDFADGQNEKDDGDVAIIDSDGEPIPKATDCTYNLRVFPEHADICQSRLSKSLF
jgi:hypothetical protein